MMTLTLEEATELRHLLSHMCVSYYNAACRNAIEKAIVHCDALIAECEEIQLDPKDDEET